VRLWANAREPSDKLDKAGHVFELTATTLGVLALAWCRKSCLDSPSQRCRLTHLVVGTSTDASSPLSCP
jgi:hypothetical protein